MSRAFSWLNLEAICRRAHLLLGGFSVSRAATQVRCLSGRIDLDTVRAEQGEHV